MSNRKISTTQQSHQIAVEHYLWARKNGFSDEAIMKSIGLPTQHQPAKGSVIDALRRTWLALQCGWLNQSQQFEDNPRAVRAMSYRRAAE